MIEKHGKKFIDFEINQTDPDTKGLDDPDRNLQARLFPRRFPEKYPEMTDDQACGRNNHDLRCEGRKSEK